MGVLRKNHRSSKNPYAGRGLERFALVSAELEAKRKTLVAQLGTQLSFVRFAIRADQQGWSPVFVCPALSKAEMQELKRAATQLIAEERNFISSASAQQSRTPEVSICERHVPDSNLACYEVKNVLDHGHDPPACIPAGHAQQAQNFQAGTLPRLLAATERLLWMAAFTVSIAADTISSVFLCRWPHATEDEEAPPKRMPPSARSFEEESDRNVRSSMAFHSLAPIRAPANIPAKGIKGATTVHAGASKTLIRCEGPGSSTAPSTPRNSRQARKSFQASVSFPTITRLRDETPRATIAKDSRFPKSLSLPKVSPHSQEHCNVQRRAASMAGEALLKRKRKERSEKLGQALTGAGLALGLGGLIMGYIPAIICVVWWWYALPSLRKAVGDQPFVKSHHL